MKISARAVLVVRKGRKRKQGYRHPCGQLIDPSKAEVTETEKAVAKVIAISQPHRRAIPAELRHDAKAENALGRLELGGKISRKQYEAGKWYAGVVRRYRQVIMAPNPTPGSIAGAQIVGAGGPMHIDDDEVERRTSIYNSAVEFLFEKKGQRVAKAVAHVAVNDREADRECLRLLVLGLEALAVHRGLKKPQSFDTEKQNGAR